MQGKNDVPHLLQHPFDTKTEQYNSLTKVFLEMTYLRSTVI